MAEAENLGVTEDAGFDPAQAEELRYDRPIPGQGLLGDPEAPLPFERPPEFSDYEGAQTHIFETLTDMSEKIIDVVDAGFAVEVVTEQVLMKGYMKGKWTVDLMLLLIEPTMYTILFICEMAGVEYIISEEEEDEHTDSETQYKAEGHLSKYIGKVGAGIDEENLQQGITAALPPSLLERATGENNAN